MMHGAVEGLSAVSTSGAWLISGAGEFPADHPENFRWNGDMALDGDLVYASSEINVSLQKPTFSVLVEEQVLTISDVKAGLWDGSLEVANLQVHLPSKEKKLRIETQLTLDGARSQSIINSFSEARPQPAVVPLNWRRLANQRMDWKGAWQISGQAEIPADHSEHVRWNGDVALDGDFVYESGEANIALQKPTFSVRVEDQVLEISDFKAGLWDGNLNVPKMLIYVPSKGKKVRFETQLTINGAQSQSVKKSFSVNQKQPRVVRLSWKNAWRMNVAGEIPVDHLKTSAGTVMWHSAATSSMRAAKQRSHCRSRLFQCASKSRWWRSPTSRRASGRGV